MCHFHMLNHIIVSHTIDHMTHVLSRQIKLVFLFGSVQRKIRLPGLFFNCIIAYRCCYYYLVALVSNSVLGCFVIYFTYLVQFYQHRSVQTEQLNIASIQLHSTYTYQAALLLFAFLLLLLLAVC